MPIKIIWGVLITPKHSNQCIANRNTLFRVSVVDILDGLWCGSVCAVLRVGVLLVRVCVVVACYSLYGRLFLADWRFFRGSPCMAVPVSCSLGVVGSVCMWGVLCRISVLLHVSGGVYWDDLPLLSRVRGWTL